MNVEPEKDSPEWWKRENARNRLEGVKHKDIPAPIASGQSFKPTERMKKLGIAAVAKAIIEES